MTLADIVEQLAMEYSLQIELSFDHRARTRNLRCNFCNRPFKYQMVLEEHVTSNHMTDLKQLTDDERRDFLQKYIKDESKMLYPDFHRQRFGGLQQGSTARKVGPDKKNSQKISERSRDERTCASVCIRPNIFDS